MNIAYLAAGGQQYRLEYGGIPAAACLYPPHVQEAIAECQQYGTLADGTPKLFVTISTAFTPAEQVWLTGRLIRAWHGASKALAGQR